ncbi:MAG: hypothetical protein J5979_03900 [Lachnospiraceae bacterium]|nr:hypothetical protein [Lachnospiraceae bacterium]
MIKLKKDKKTIEVGTKVQAAPFIRAGYEIVSEESDQKETASGRGKKTDSGEK